ncbi:class II fructose-bisphosphate aldolase [Muricomes sp. OA1]|uniref:Class II fructose-bisphosphate aldolase n=1 Tax=Hungatella hathewayi TaxID=154046 RepID=A0A3E2X1W7_9FIRM|nr:MULTISPECIES: class II fructose-bisphosphate aldolase [Clostridia]MCH1971747.1 class II fructose-bisphosphate aldolase [Muricomes sp. OA1]RGC35474.1 class II fructose-bisphosphate aldolase [Hungatella hathewayi]GKH35021.1 fructose-bisphosphate aldolase [Faecalicatena contorta]
MPLVKVSEILKEADKGGYAVTAFDTFNFETINWVIEAAAELKTATIVMIYPEMTEYISVDTFARIVETLAAKSEYPVGLMLDHGDSYELAMQCLKAGFTSIMVDFSSCEFEENVRRTREVVKAAHAMGVDVEAELGHVGNADTLADFADDSGYTSPELAKQFVERTECDVLAIAFGSAHGNYVREPKLDMERLDAIKREVSIPLVLHGGTGIPDSQIREAVKRGIRKLNVGTGYDQTIFYAVQKNIKEDVGEPYIFCTLADAAQAAKAFLKEKISLTRW